MVVMQDVGAASQLEYRPCTRRASDQRNMPNPNQRTHYTGDRRLIAGYTASPAMKCIYYTDHWWRWISSISPLSPVLAKLARVCGPTGCLTRRKNRL